jgi:hypothetical protein
MVPRELKSPGLQSPNEALGGAFTHNLGNREARPELFPLVRPGEPGGEKDDSDHYCGQDG